MDEREAIDNVTGLLLSVPLQKMLGPDLFVGLLLGAGAFYLEVFQDGEYVAATLPATANLVGVIVGLSLAAIAIQTAFLDLAYLRIAASAGIDPVRTLPHCSVDCRNWPSRIPFGDRQIGLATIIPGMAGRNHRCSCRTIRGLGNRLSSINNHNTN